ncbi:helix-turn-helix domain-containing protein [Candidatus Pacearchaeota archaeon]|nr:helix-turn-helix domain-containing protein [Candidatus Pacearchaeota archaeon]
MKKEEVRKEFFKLKIKGHTNNQCRKILLAQFGYEICKRTLQRWIKKLNKDDWDLKDKSKRPKTIYYKITSEIEDKIISLKNKT